MSFGLFKFFRGSTIIDGDKFLSSYQDIEEDMEIIGAAGFSKPYKFMRFKSTYEWPHWGYNRSTVDAACWIPNKNVILYGFSVYAACEPQFNLSFKVYINDTVVEEGEMTCSDYEDKYFCRIILKKFHSIKANSKLEITAQLTRVGSSDSYLDFYYGEQGSMWREVENDHMDLWTVESSSKSGSSSISYGNFPEIMYYV
uniref:PHR domain-containing protein n=1 Tax=Euplotes crassus TaxID=5936 RepID=A0A7S3K7D7_EUPCR